MEVLLKKLRLFLLISVVVITYIGFVNHVFIEDNVEISKKKKKNGRKPLNVIFMISDGFGPTSETFGRTYYQYLNNATFSEQTPLDKMLVGQSRTRSANSLITDSAAGATAFSCGKKTYNYGVAVDESGKACATLLEGAHDMGMLTAMVVTSRITHATPAAFSSHALDRNDEDFIASWLVPSEGNKYERQVDLMFGGGSCHFIPSTFNSSCRNDEINLLNNDYYTFINDRTSFDELSDKAELPIMGLFTPDHMSFEIDRDETQEPALWEMTSKALNILSNKKNSKKGFFMLIEGSKIDMTAHGNDAAAHAKEIMAYYKTVEVVQKFVEENPNTLVVSVSDHETGGFALGYQPTKDYPKYIWYPEVVEKVKKSTPWVANKIRSSENFETIEINNILEEYLGIEDATAEELDLIKYGDLKKQELANALAKMVNQRALLGWTTHGHSGTDVNLYAMGKFANAFRGNHENTEIGHILQKILRMNLDTLTESLFGDYEFPQKNETETNSDNEIHYHQH